MTRYDQLTVIVPCKGQDCKGVEQRTAMLPALVIRDQLYGQAIKHGMQQATTTYVATMDADGQHDPADVYRLYDVMLNEKVDMVIGKRRGAPLTMRTVASGLLNLSASIMAGQHVPDFGSGLRIFKRAKALDYLAVLPDGFDFNAVLTMKYMLSGAEVLWVDIPVRPRQRGRSHVCWRDGVITLRSLARARHHR